MLSIGEFARLCRVSAKTLRYYSDIGLLTPETTNRETGYRYYSVEQLDRVLLINRLKSYNFSLKDIKRILESGMDYVELGKELDRKKSVMEREISILGKNLDQINSDLHFLKQNRSFNFLNHDIDVQLVEYSPRNLLFIRKMVEEDAMEKEYSENFSRLMRKIEKDNLTVSSPPMVLFYSDGFEGEGLDMEFAMPVEEYITGTRTFDPKLCLKTVLKGPYSGLSSVYARQIKWAEENGFQPGTALFEVYVTDPSQVESDSELITEVYYPVSKKQEHKKERKHAF